MNFVNVTAPIQIEELKKYFVDKNTFYNIDYKNSALKGSKVLTYLSNLDIPANLDLKDLETEELQQLIKEYMECTFIVNISSLENIVIDVLLEYKGLVSGNKYSEFIASNKEIVELWIKKLDSLTLYNMYSIDDPKFNEFVSSFPKDETDSLVGVNFISLIKNDKMYLLYNKIDKSNLTFYVKYFNEYMFKGKNLYSYWANENNPLFLLTFNIAEGKVKGQEYAEIIKNEESANVSPI